MPRRFLRRDGGALFTPNIADIRPRLRKPFLHQHAASVPAIRQTDRQKRALSVPLHDALTLASGRRSLCSEPIGGAANLASAAMLVHSMLCLRMQFFVNHLAPCRLCGALCRRKLVPAKKLEQSKHQREADGDRDKSNQANDQALPLGHGTIAGVSMPGCPSTM